MIVGIGWKTTRAFAPGQRPGSGTGTDPGTDPGPPRCFREKADVTYVRCFRRYEFLAGAMCFIGAYSFMRVGKRDTI